MNAGSPARSDLEELLHELPLVEFRMDADGICTLSRGAGLARFDAADGDFVGSSPLEDFAGAREAMQRAYAGEKVIENLFTEYEGRPWAVLALLIPDGAGGIIGFCIDVTDRHVAEEALRREEARYRLLAENVSDVIVLLDDAGIIEYVSPSVTAVLGRGPDDFVGHHFVDFIHPDDIAVASTPDGIAPPGLYAAELRVRQGVDDWCWVEAASRYVEGPGGRMHSQALIRDVTERRSQRAALLLATERAEAASRAKSAFLANMSAEIRDPILGILTAAEKGATADISTAASALLHLVDGILDLAELEAGVLELRSSPIRLGAFARMALRPFEQAAAAKGLCFTLTVDPPADEVPVMGDEARLRQVLTEIVDNAVSYTDSGAVDVSVARGDDNWFRFSVADTGPGIDADAQPGLFDAFRGGGVDGGGPGLGLAVAKRLTDLMHGTLQVESGEGAGTTFVLSVRLPPATAIQVADECESRHILLVEDDPDNLAVALRCLDHLGHHVEAVCTGAAALMAMARSDVELVLLDCELPDMDGFELARRIRLAESRERRRRTPVVGVTLDPVGDVRDRCADAGMDDVVAKPYRDDILQAAISRLSLSAKSS